MSRLSRLIEKREPFRDTRLIVIACEGQKTEPEYFRMLNRELHTSRVRLVIANRCNPTASSPLHVVESLVEYISANQIQDDDQLWAVIDRNSWPNGQLHEAIRACKDRGFRLCMSNPCFEVWLAVLFSQTKEALPSAEKSKEWKQFIGQRRQGFSTQSLYEAHVLRNTQLMVERAKEWQLSTGDKIDVLPSTDVGLLVEEMLNLSK